VFGCFRVVKGGEALAQIAQTDYTLFRHAGATVEESGDAQIVVVACICVMLLARCCKKKREVGLLRKSQVQGSLMYLGLATHVSS